MAFPKRFYVSYPLVGALGLVIVWAQWDEVRALGPQPWGLGAIALIAGMVVGAMTCRAASSDADRPDVAATGGSVAGIMLGISAAFTASRTGSQALLLWCVAALFVGLALGFLGYLCVVRTRTARRR